MQIQALGKKIPDRNIQPGDTVACKPGFQGRNGRNTTHYGGAGYESGRVFMVARVDGPQNPETRKKGNFSTVVWPISTSGESLSGIYLPAVELVRRER